MSTISIFGGIFDIPSLESTLEKLKSKTMQDNFWATASSAQSTLKRISVIEKELTLWSDAQTKRDDLEVLLDFLMEDVSMKSEAESELVL